MKKIGILTAFMLLLLVGITYAAPTIQRPTTGATVSGNYLFNVSSSDFSDGAAYNMTHCTITLSSALAGTSYTLTVYNISTGDGVAQNASNATINTRGYVDASDYTATAICYNNTLTKGGTSAAVTGLIIDNHSPTCTPVDIVKATKYKPDKTWTVTGVNATSATVQFGSNTLYTMTEAAAGDSFTYKGDIPNGMYQIKIITSDGASTTTCLVDDVSVHSDEAGKLAIGLVDNSQKTAPKDNTILWLIGGVGLLVYLRTRKN